MASPFHILSNPPAPPVPPPDAHPRPDWLRVKFPGGERFQDLKRLMRTLDLHTVCESARCPNMGECWEHGAATFMILGDRKSTRLNSSHVAISYAVFCLKKKNSR